ncbi:MAG: hypothetical protein NZM04_06150 [Methylacidiphilales bacterium]|nr:hypothetical protein [Candidatus Methylacidiphilales bacterium]
MDAKSSNLKALLYGLGHHIKPLSEDDLAVNIIYIGYIHIQKISNTGQDLENLFKSVLGNLCYDLIDIPPADALKIIRQSHAADPKKAATAYFFLVKYYLAQACKQPSVYDNNGVEIIYRQARDKIVYSALPWLANYVMRFIHSTQIDRRYAHFLAGIAGMYDALNNYKAWIHPNPFSYAQPYIKRHIVQNYITPYENTQPSNFRYSNMISALDRDPLTVIL